MRGADKVVCQAATVLLLFALTAAPAVTAVAATVAAEHAHHRR